MRVLLTSAGLETEEIKEYFDIEVRFNIMLADVNRIISESVKDLI